MTRIPVKFIKPKQVIISLIYQCKLLNLFFSFSRRITTLRLILFRNTQEGFYYKNWKMKKNGHILSFNQILGEHTRTFIKINKGNNKELSAELYQIIE